MFSHKPLPNHTKSWLLMCIVKTFMNHNSMWNSLSYHLSFILWCDKKTILCLCTVTPKQFTMSSVFLFWFIYDLIYLYCSWLVLVWLWQCGMHKCAKERGEKCCGMGRRQGVWVWEWRGMKGWGVGCECDGLVSNTLSLSISATLTIPQLSTTVQCVSKPLCCCHFNQCVGAAVLSHFFPLSISFLIDEWLWGWCHCRAAISPMPGSTRRCVSCHTMRLSFFWIMAETVFLHEMFVVFAERMDSQKVHLLVWKSPTVASQICTQSAHDPLWFSCHTCTYLFVVWREIWCATCHTWLQVWSEGIRVTLIHATLLTLTAISLVSLTMRHNLCLCQGFIHIQKPRFHHKHLNYLKSRVFLPIVYWPHTKYWKTNKREREMKRVINVVFVLKQSTNVLKKPPPVILPVICSWLSFLSFVVSGSRLITSFFNVVFILCISLIAFTPSSPISFPVIHLFFPFLSPVLSSLPVKSSDVNVLFIFIISHNPFAPSSPILFPDIHSFILFSLLSVLSYLSNSVFSKWCWLSAFHSMLLLLHLQSCSLLFIQSSCPFFFLFSFFLTLQVQWSQSSVHFQCFTQCLYLFISNLIPCHSFFPSLSLSLFTSLLTTQIQFPWCDLVQHFTKHCHQWCS